MVTAFPAPFALNGVITTVAAVVRRAVGVPVIAQVTLFRDKPTGRAAEAVQAVKTDPLAQPNTLLTTLFKVYAVALVYLHVVGTVSAATTITNVMGAPTPLPLLGVTVKLVLLRKIVGVPEMAQLEVLKSKPAGTSGLMVHNVGNATAAEQLTLLMVIGTFA